MSNKEQKKNKMKTFLAVLFDEAASLLRSHRLHLHSEDLRSPMNNVRSFTHYHFIKKTVHIINVTKGL